jgi:hypothetical protein
MRRKTAIGNDSLKSEDRYEWQPDQRFLRKRPLEPPRGARMLRGTSIIGIEQKICVEGDQRRRPGESNSSKISSTLS